jgi:hypothetical protein
MMHLLPTFKSWVVLTLATLLASCTGTHEVTYRGGVLVVPGPLAIEDHYAFRFVDKWRISHAWLSGPVDIDYCRYSRRDNNRGEDRFFEIEGILKIERVSDAPQDKGKKYTSNRDEKVYGAYPSTGPFKGYSAFCNHTFQDIWTGPSVFLLKPDPAKGTDAWIVGAKPVVVNGLQWLRKDIPIEDYSQNHKQWAAPIEIWVLRIPDTPYWFVMRLSGSSGGTGTAPGRNRNPEKYARVLDLFHQMVASVKLEPITPVDISTLGIKSVP